MLKRIFVLIVGLLCSFLVSATPIDQKEPYQMMKQVSEKAFDRLKKEQDLIHKQPELLKTIVDEELMPYVNDKYAALKLLGSNVRTSKREDVLVFIKAFRKYLVASYAQVLTQYTDQSIEFGPKPVIDGDQRITGVKVDIIDTPRPNIKLEFKLRKEKNGDWYVFDMIAEGVSLLSSKQSEWNSTIRQDGVLAAANQLEDLASQPIHFEKKEQSAAQ